MYPLSTAARIALGESHGMRARVTITSPALGVLHLPISGGSVTADATSQVRRTATIQADSRRWPASPQDLLAPYGSTAYLEYGILPRGASLPEWIPLGSLYLDKTTRSRPLSGTGDIPVELVDRSARVAEDRLDTPSQTVAGATAVSEIRRLVQDSQGTVTVIDTTGSTQIASRMDIERDRWADGIEKLADLISAEVYFDVQGNLVIRPQPTLTDSPVWTLTTRAARANIVASRDQISRENVYNRVVASGQRSDGTTPVYAGVSDTNPASPTLYGGPFGKKPRFYASALLTTVAQCTATATALLARVTGASTQIDVDVLPNPALEPGDVILHDDNGVITTHIIDRVVTPLSPGAVQSITTRSLDLPAES